jgi:hypothetical protein
MRRWADQVGPAVLKAAPPFTQRVADTVSARVPHLTGQLASSVTTGEDDDGVEVGYDGSAPYDGWIEFGGSRGRSHVPDGRYLYPSATEAADEWYELAAVTADDTARSYPWSTQTV